MSKRRADSRRWGDGYIQVKVLKSGITRYYARWREPDPVRGSILRSRGFHDEASAMKFLVTNGESRREGSYEPEPTITLSQAVTDYCDARLEKEHWKTNTYFTNKVFQEKLIDPQLGKLRVTRIRPMQIQAWADQLVTSKSPSTVRSTLSIVRGSIRRMMQLGVITTNPADAVEVRVRMKGKTDVWSIEEVRQILQAVKTDKMWFGFYSLGFGTGMRPGELRALRWSDIDWETNAVTCERTITKDERGREIVGETTKTGSSRVVVIGQQVADALKEWKPIQNERRLRHGDWRDTMIFDRGNGEFIPGTTLISKHNALCESIDVSRFSPHAMRHTAATMEDEFGASSGVTRARLGHASENMTKRYTHAQIKAQKATAEHMAQLLLGEDEDTTTFSGNG